MIKQTFVILKITCLILSFQINGIAQEKTPIIIDADTGNEVDDYYALARAFVEPSWK